MKIERNYFFTCQELNDKEKRNLLIYDLIRKKGVISRAEITKATGINAVSVSNYVNNFIEKKMVLEKGFDVSSGGRKPELVELDSESNYVIGINIGKANIRSVVADIGLSVKARKQVSRPSDRGMSGEIVKLIEEIIRDSKISASNIKAIGLGVSAAKFDQAAGVIKKETGIDAYAGPSAVCAAFAEKRFNKAAENFENMLYIYSDVGEGVMTRGEAYLSASEDAELLDGKLRYLRPWDDYLSIVESAKREVARGVGTKIVSLASGRMDNITKEVVVAAAKADDEVALNIAFGVGINLGLRIAYLINLFTPEVIVIGDGLQDTGDIIFMPLKKMIERLSYRNNMKNLKIILGAFGEDAPEIGAASLAVREIFLKA
ncbi:MAG: ROK family protein [Candidatus Omnitrophica bacterium]|nr:ROK family protein [Candidatus Omnitrophota bacterium]